MKLKLSLVKVIYHEQSFQRKDLLIISGITILVWFIYFQSNFTGLKHPDTMHYASVARNIVHGQGMVANSTTSAQIAVLKTDYFRFVASSFLHPLVISLFFLAFGINDYAVALSSGMFYLLAVPIIYLLANNLFSRKVGIVSALLYAINLEILDYSISGLTEPLFIFILLISFLILCKSYSARHFFLTGALLGLARLTRINAIIFILPFIVYIYRVSSTRKITNILAFLTGFVVLSCPVLYRDYLIFKDPMFSGYHFDLLQFKYPANIIGRTLLLSNSLDFIKVIFSDPISFIKNCISNMHMYYVNFLGITKPLIMSFFIVSVFRWYESRRVNAIKITLYMAIAIQMLILSVSRQPIRYFHIFIPFIIMFSIEYLTYLLAMLPIRKFMVKYVVGTCLVLVLSCPFFYVTASGIHRKVNGNVGPGFYWIKDFLEKNTSSNDVVLTNHGAAMWYGNRKTVSLPISVNVMEQIDANFLPISAIFLTSDDDWLFNLGSSLSETEMRYIEEWKGLLFNPPKRFGNFELHDSFSNGKLKAVLFKKVKR